MCVWDIQINLPHRHIVKSNERRTQFWIHIDWRSRVRSWLGVDENLWCRKLLIHRYYSMYKPSPTVRLIPSYMDIVRWKVLMAVRNRASYTTRTPRNLTRASWVWCWLRMQELRARAPAIYIYIYIHCAHLRGDSYLWYFAHKTRNSCYSTFAVSAEDVRDSAWRQWLCVCVCVFFLV